MKFTGMHATGKGRGRILGYPTINLHDINTVIVQDGIYAAWATINGVTFMAAMFVGEPVTFKDKDKSVELYLIGLKEGDEKKYNLSPLITTKISVETVRYLRPVIKFNSKADLIERIKADVIEIQDILTAQPTKA